MPRLEYRAARIVEIGERLYGVNRWQSAFARMCGMSQSYISMIAKGDRPVTEAVRDAIGKGLRVEATKLRKRAAEFNEAAEDFGE